MPSLLQQVIPVATFVRIELRTENGLAVLKITNEGANPMQYRTEQGMYGDVIPPNNGSCAYLYCDGDRPPATFWVYGVAADTFSVYYQARDETHEADC